MCGKIVKLISFCGLAAYYSLVASIGILGILQMMGYMHVTINENNNRIVTDKLRDIINTEGYYLKHTVNGKSYEVANGPFILYKPYYIIGWIKNNYETSKRLSTMQLFGSKNNIDAIISNSLNVVESTVEQELTNYSNLNKTRIIIPKIYTAQQEDIIKDVKGYFDYYSKIDKIYPVSMLIYGESGTGKDSIAYMLADVLDGYLIEDYDKMVFNYDKIVNDYHMWKDRSSKKTMRPLIIFIDNYDIILEKAETNLVDKLMLSKLLNKISMTANVVFVATTDKNISWFAEPIDKNNPSMTRNILRPHYFNKIIEMKNLEGDDLTDYVNKTANYYGFKNIRFVNDTNIVHDSGSININYNMIRNKSIGEINRIFKNARGVAKELIEKFNFF